MGRREFLHVDDMAAGCYKVMKMSSQTYEQSLTGDALASDYSAPSFLNVGTGKDCTISEVASLIQEVVGYQGEICYDTSQPDGTPKKLLDVTRIERKGWRPQFTLKSGLRDTYEWYCSKLSNT